MPDAPEVDAANGGLTIELVAKNGVPQMSTIDVEITKVVIGATSIRAIGDAAPGDMRTTRLSYEFEWRDHLVPIPFKFPEAPPGVYSMIDFHVADSELSSVAVGILGRVRRAGTLVPFEVQNQTASVTVTIPIDVVLVPRTGAIATIELDVAALVDGIDWDAVPLTADGTLYIGDADAAMPGVITRVATAFTARP
jgi:hypothetical protein